MTPLLSIIVPVYNASLHIERCVTSLMEQMIEENVEFIFVDDGSTDSSIEQIKQIAGKYPKRKDQIRFIFHATNQGVYLTRKHGLQASKGQYIGWCDSDDWIDKDYFQSLLDATNNGSIDIVVCNYTHIWQDRSSVCHYDIQPTPLACIEQNYRTNSLPMELYIHLFKKEIIQQAFDRIYPTNLGEDTYSIIHAYTLAKSIAYIPSARYFYDHRNEQSIMHTRQYTMVDWLPHQRNIETIAETLYALPHGKQRFHLSVNSMKYWRKVGYRNAFATEWDFYHTFRECYRDINTISHTAPALRVLVYLLYNIYPLYWLGKKLRIL